MRGVTPQLLFGADINRNGQLDPHELDEETTSVVGRSTIRPSFRGWSAYLTLYSLEWNVNPDGQPRIYLNEPDLNKLYDQLEAVFPADWATFIIAYRQAGPYHGHERRPKPAAATLEHGPTRPRRRSARCSTWWGPRCSYTFAGRRAIDAPRLAVWRPSWGR